MKIYWPKTMMKQKKIQKYLVSGMAIDFQLKK